MLEKEKREFGKFTKVLGNSFHIFDYTVIVLCNFLCKNDGIAN